MLLAEAERDFSAEETLIEDRTEYSRNNAAWGTINSYGNINLAATGIVVIALKGKSDVFPNVNMRVKIGATYYVCASGATIVTTGWTEYYCICVVASGVQAVIVEGRTNGATSVLIKDFILGHVVLQDDDLEVLYSGTASKSLTVANRTSFYGSLAKTVLAVNVVAQTPGAVTNFENVGDALGNGVQVLIDGSQVDWHLRNQDDGAAQFEAAQGIAHVSVTTGAAHTVQITRDNANTVLHVSIVSCPWLLGGDLSEAHCPISFDFPQGSTLYVIIQPMSGLQNIGVGFGCKLACTHDEDDYFEHTVGTGSQSLSYTYEAQKTTATSYMKFTAYGITGCISYIAVDMR